MIFISLVFTKYSFLSTVRLCCPQGGVYTNVVTFIFEVFMMAPCLACKWARGKRTPQANSASKKPRYGGTDDLELGDKWRTLQYVFCEIKSTNMSNFRFLQIFFQAAIPKGGFWRRKLILYTLTSVWIFSNLFFLSFSKVMTRRICLTIKGFYGWSPFILLLWSLRLIQGWFCTEKSDARYP